MARTTAKQDRQRKPLAFEVTEPRGHTIICAQSVWDTHITRRPEMLARMGDVTAALTDPDGIRESTSIAEAQIFERVCEDSVQIRVVATFDEIALVNSGTATTIAKVNSAFPVQTDIYDTPHVGKYVYKKTKN